MSIIRIDRSSDRFMRLAEKSYAAGDMLSALRFLHALVAEADDADVETYLRIADVYENLGLQTYAIKWLYKALDVCEEEDYAEIYEGLAVNYMNLGNEGAAAYYYNALIGVDDTLTAEHKMEIARAFSKDKKDVLRFVWPPELADFSTEMDSGARLLKEGNCRGAIAAYSQVSEGNKDYVEARRMQAVAELLEGNHLVAEQICVELLDRYPSEVQTLATLAAVYLEQGRTAESRTLAERLALIETDVTEELYKIATVCCENGLHAEAYARFAKLEERMDCDGRMLYFKAVSAVKCGKLAVAESSLDRLCTLYPDAAVAKYYLRLVRDMLAGGEDKTESFSYFYCIPKQSKDAACSTLMSIAKMSDMQAKNYAVSQSLLEDFHWCFDEMDGMDRELQFLALIVAEHVRADEFLREKLLDFEVLDAIKVETLNALYERNEEETFGVVICNIYRKLQLRRIKIGRSKRKVFIGGYARAASKFAIIAPSYGAKLQRAAEKLYRRVEEQNAVEVFTSEDAIACAIFILAGLKELGTDIGKISEAFDADEATVKLLLILTGE